MTWKPKSFVRSVAGHMVYVFTPDRGAWYWRLFVWTRGNKRHGPFPTLSRAMADCADYLSVGPGEKRRVQL